MVQAPCRADLAGGILDLSPLYLFHPGSVTVNFALEILTTCRLSPQAGRRITLRSLDTNRGEEFASLDELRAAKRYQHPLAAWMLRFFNPEGGLLMETHSEAPAGAGISGSSALMVAIGAALARYTGRRLSKEDLRVIAGNGETQVIRVPAGCQDYYPALYGGVSAIELRVDGIYRRAITVAPEEINSRFVLAYTGVPRQSGINNWEVFKKHIDGDKRVHRNFEEIAAIARSMWGALATGRWDEVACLLREEWALRKKNAPGISTPFIDQLVKISARYGGVGAKVCGAGGGGCVVFMVEPGSAATVSKALGEAGGRLLPVQLAARGLRYSAGR
jgi:D-glycero-alpha-D-manno-heptose-7-phosphate kinase